MEQLGIRVRREAVGIAVDPLDLAPELLAHPVPIPEGVIRQPAAIAGILGSPARSR